MLGHVVGIDYENDRKCRMCGMENDSVYHFMVECKGGKLQSLRDDLVNHVIKDLNVVQLSGLSVEESVIGAIIAGDFCDKSIMCNVVQLVNMMYIECLNHFKK